MNLTALRTFLTIVETGSLVRASDQLNVTQSTVTARLKSLEVALGQTLIHRHKSGATLTTAGIRLLRYAETISDLWQQARQETSLPVGAQSACNLACHPDLWTGLGAGLFDYIRTHQPTTALSVWTGGQWDMARWLDSGRVDIAIGYWPNVKAGHDVRVWTHDTLVLVGDTPDRPVRFDPGYVFVEGGEKFGRDHAVAYADADTAMLSFGTAALGLDHILLHGGTAYLPQRLAAPHINAGQLFEIADAPQFRRDIYLIGQSSKLAEWVWLDAALGAAKGG